MPDLPTITVTDAQAARLLAAFEGQVDETGADLPPDEAYRRWLRDAVREKAIQVEAQNIEQRHLDAKQVALDELRNELR